MMQRERVLYLLREKRGPRTLTQAARQIGVTVGYLCNVMAGRKRPGAKILKWLGLVAVEVYQFKSNNRTKR